MVLKKSNSRFNSGNTQRLCNRGAYKNCDYYRPEPKSHSEFFIHLNGLPPIHNAYITSTEHAKALDKIYEYLGFEGPDLASFYLDEYVRSRCISLNKKDLWFLPDRVDELMKEKTFLESEKGLAEIHIHRVTKYAQSIQRKFHYKKSTILRPGVMDEEVKLNQQEIKTMPKQNSRGVQRTHLHRPISKKTFKRFEDRKLSTKKVTIILQDKDHIDTRNLVSPQGDPSIGSVSMRPKYKSLFKAKSWKHGKHSVMRGYNDLQIKQDTEIALRDLRNATHWPNCDNEYEIIDEQEDYIRDPLHLGWDISIRCKKSRTKSRKDKNKYPLFDEEQRVNSASSQLTIRHPKGSFEFIDKPSDEEMSSDDDFVHVTTDELNEIEQTHIDLGHTDIQRHDVKEIDEMSKYKTQPKLESFDSSDNFVRVNLHLDDNIQKMLTAPRLIGSKLNPVSEKDCTVSFGNCFPPVFCVRLHTENPGLDKGWSLVGASSSDLKSDKDLSWNVTLKNNQTTDVDDIVKDRFLSCLDLQSNNDLSLECLIDMALTSILSSVNTGKDKSNVGEENFNETCNSNVFSLNEALKKLDVIENESKVSHDENLTATQENVTQVKIIDVSVDCDICLTTCDKYGQVDSGIIVLLSCRHSFCYGCWKTHIFHSMIRGDHQVKCMHANCNQLLNEAMANTLVPETYMKRFYSQQRERKIDRSPFCQWCPKKTCNKIAVIEDRSPYLQQFGCSISCDCSSSWCFTCHKLPHWPASCGQNAAYKSLLGKVGEGLPATGVTLSVELKPCPGCKYPIEKSEGCPHMTCRMCWYDFCWNCLRSIYDHSVFECEVDESSNFVTYKLHNDIASSFPLKFFNNAMEIKKKIMGLKKADLQGWLNGLCVAQHRFEDLPFYRSVQLEDIEISRDTAIILAKDTVAFLMKTYSFMEYFYILLSFAFMNKDIDTKESYMNSIMRMCNFLEFITSRLEELIVKKHIRQIIKVKNSCQMFPSNGSEALDKLKRNVKRFQKLSQDVPTEWVGELDPAKYFRYK